MRRLIRVIRRYRLVGALIITVLVFGGAALQQYQQYRRLEDVYRESMATWLLQHINCSVGMDTHLVQALLETDAKSRAESLQYAKAQAERGYSLLFVAPFANPWRYDFIMKTRYHVPWGDFVTYLDYTSQLKETLPLETRVALNELRQRLMSLEEHTTKLRDLIYGPDWRGMKHRPVVQEAFEAWLEQMQLPDIGELDAAYQAHRQAQALPLHSWPGVPASYAAWITEEEAIARVKQFMLGAGLTPAGEPILEGSKRSQYSGKLWLIAAKVQQPTASLRVAVSQNGGHIVDVRAAGVEGNQTIFPRLLRDLALAWARSEGEEILPYRASEGTQFFEMEFVVVRENVPLQSRKIWTYFTTTAPKEADFQLSLESFYQNYASQPILAASISSESALSSLDPAIAVSGSPHLTVVRGRRSQERLAYAIPLAEMPGVMYVYVDAETGAVIGQETSNWASRAWEFTSEWIESGR